MMSHEDDDHSEDFKMMSHENDDHSEDFKMMGHEDDDHSEDFKSLNQEKKAGVWVPDVGFIASKEADWGHLRRFFGDFSKNCATN